MTLVILSQSPITAWYSLKSTQTSKMIPGQRFTLLIKLYSRYCNYWAVVMSAVIIGNADSGIMCYISLEQYTNTCCMLQYECMCGTKHVLISFLAHRNILRRHSNEQWRYIYKVYQDKALKKSWFYFMPYRLFLTQVLTMRCQKHLKNDHNNLKAKVTSSKTQLH